MKTISTIANFRCTMSRPYSKVDTKTLITSFGPSYGCSAA